MGELHLDIKVDILKRTHKVEVEVGQPQVAYRESITRQVEDVYTHKNKPVVPDSSRRLITALAWRARHWFPSSQSSRAVTYRANSGCCRERLQNQQGRPHQVTPWST